MKWIVHQSKSLKVSNLISRVYHEILHPWLTNIEEATEKTTPEASNLKEWNFGLSSWKSSEDPNINCLENVSPDKPWYSEFKLKLSFESINTE